MANELPEDLVTQILLYLPVVSLLRFKRVCKSWYALITHQSFITKHLLHNKNRNTLILPKIIKDNVVSMISYETLQVSHTQPVPPPFFDVDYEANIVYFVGSCNGLVCIHCRSRDEFNFVIWNPATKETKVVPKLNLPRITPAGYRSTIERMGFGFDAKTNDYKIINLLNHPNFHHSTLFQSEVYSLSADSWRKVNSPPCFITGLFRGMMTYINGMASWRAHAADWDGIFSFDMSDEVFLKTRLPDDVLNNSRDNSCFFVLNESIAMAVDIDNYSDEEQSKICFDIWLLLEVGVKDSWTKLFTIGPFTEIREPLGFWKNDTMFLKKYDGKMVLYDPSTKQMTNLQINLNFYGWVTYMETLVSVKGSK